MSALAPAGESLATSPPFRPPGAGRSTKKGLGISGKTPDISQKLRDLRCQWYYTWAGTMPQGAPSEISFIPMIWKYNGDRQSILAAAAGARKAGIKELLGFNEPDQSEQANMTVEQALEAWPVLQETGLRLGSPACVHPDNKWMMAFMKGAKKLGLKIDFVCVHSYGAPDTKHFLRRMHELHKLHRKPIWITEFAVGDWNAKSPAENQFNPDRILGFMEEVLPKLNKLDFIERYAWFPAKRESSTLGTSALFDADGKLTRLGKCYRDS